MAFEKSGIAADSLSAANSLRIVLASGSPRRIELMRMLNAPGLTVIPPLADEANSGKHPIDLVRQLSIDKAKDVAQRCLKDDVVIAADTVVSICGRILGKPKDEPDACGMLETLSGKTHSVFTGVTVISGDEVITEHEETLVTFRTLTHREITAYVRTGEPMDKAGAYAAQGLAALFVERLDGDFFNVMGLPVCLLGKMLEKLGVSLI